MQELKRLQWIVIMCSVGVVVSFGGAVFTAYREHQAKKALELPQDRIPVPATAQ